MRKFLFQLALICTLIALSIASYGQVLMGSAPSYNEISTDPIVNFYDPGGIPDFMGDNQDPQGRFAPNLNDTMTLKTNIANTQLYIIFEEFGVGEGDTLFIFDGNDVTAPLIGFYNSVNTPGEITATGRSLTFVFISDSITDPTGLCEGWNAKANAYLSNPEECLLSLENFGMTWMTCNAKFYDSGGPNNNIADQFSDWRWVEFTSPVGSHIKIEFSQFNVAGIMRIYDGQYNDPNHRLIGQFCSSTSTPPVLFSSASTIAIAYKSGGASDLSKPGWKATVSCVPELFESPDGSACPSVSIMVNSEVIDLIEKDCNDPTTILEADIIATGPFANDYTITSIPYNPPFEFDAGTSINASVDDNWITEVNLPFSFSFFGNAYNKAYPGANGIISFTYQAPNSYCKWSTAVPPDMPPYANVPYNYANCIYGVYEDIYPGHYINNGAIKYDVMGVEPCRTFVFNYKDVGLFSCWSNGNNYFQTYQMVIYEGTNIIDVYIHHRAECSSWNGGRGVIGLHNNNSAQILTVPNRDFSQSWTADDEAWRFTPITPMDPNATLTWYEGSVAPENEIGHTKKLVVTPSHTTNYIVEYHYTNAANDSFTLYDTLTIHVTIPAVTATNNAGVGACPGDPVNLSVNAQGIGNIVPTNFAWSSGDSTETCIVHPNDTTDYIVTVTFSNGCKNYDTTTVKVVKLEMPKITASDSTGRICKGESIDLTGTHPTTDDLTWNTGSTAHTITVSPEDTTDYIIEAIMDGDCHTTDTFRVYVMPNPKAAFYPEPTEIYVNDGVGTVTCTNMTVPEHCSLHWDFGDQFSPANEIVEPDGISNSTITHDYTHAGYYAIKLSVADSNNCVDSTLARVSVSVPYFFYVPNSFTPNGDGINETFAPKGEGVNPEGYVMYIYDRTGQLMFKTNNPYDYWDGHGKNGNMCPAGVYVYLIRFTTLNGDPKEYTGSVTLIK